MRNLYKILIVVFSIFLMSCGSSRYSVGNFIELSDVSHLDGSYKNRFYEQSDSIFSLTDGKMSRIFDIYADSINYINLRFEKENVTIVFQTDSGLQEKFYKGKLKNNYFELYTSQKIVPIPFLFFGWDWRRLRIGLNENKDLLIQYWQNSFGWILFGSAGRSEDKEYTFQKIEN